MRHRIASVVTALCIHAAAGWTHDSTSPLTKAHETPTSPSKLSRPGKNEWNKGSEPKDWWAEIETRHGHVGPWNVLGYRMGKAILREMHAQWGDHSTVVTSHIPLRMPYSCIIDGLAAGTGNSEGRLDLRMGEVALPEFVHISARQLDGSAVLVLKPRQELLQRIEAGTGSDLDRLSHECREAPESVLFDVVYRSR